MNNSKPFLSIGIPTINRLKLLKLCVKSVLDQRFENMEIIISNNSSNDGTKEFLNSLDDPRIKVFHQESTISMVDNWNFCLNNADGEYFLLLSDDDLLDSSYVENIYNSYLEANTQGYQLSIIYGRTITIDSDHNVITEKYMDAPSIEPGECFITEWLKDRRSPQFCSTLYKTQDLKINDGFNKNNQYPADSLARAVLSINSNILFVKDAISYYRVHQNNATNASFNSRSRLECNMLMIDQLCSYIANQELRTKINLYGNEYCRKRFIKETSMELRSSFSFKNLKEFVGVSYSKFKKNAIINDLILLAIYLIFRTNLLLKTKQKLESYYLNYKRVGVKK